jgi:hypothetical protein
MISLKQFRIEEAERTGLTQSAIAMRLARKQYRGVTLRTFGDRQIYITSQPVYAGAKHLAVPKRKSA